MTKRFEVYFDCDNAAFDISLAAGIKAMLKYVRWMVGQSRDLADESDTVRNVVDDNGNTIGKWRFSYLPGQLRVVGAVGIWVVGVGPLPEGWRYMFDEDRDADHRFVIRLEPKS